MNKNHGHMIDTEYFALEGVSCSQLKGLDNARRYKYQREHGIDIDPKAASIGTATHQEILGGGTTIVVGCKDRRSKAWKEAVAEAPEGANVITAADYELVKGMADSVLANEKYAELAAQQHETEVAIQWLDEPTDTPCKGKLDAVSDDFIFDVKTTTEKNAGYLEFRNTIARYAYHMQAAFYLDGMTAIDGKNRDWYFVVVEKAPPYCVAVYELSGSAIEAGRKLYRKYLSKLAMCEEFGIYEDYPGGLIDLPAWAEKG
jgi:hypothetical protein